MARGPTPLYGTDLAKELQVGQGKLKSARLA